MTGDAETQPVEGVDALDDLAGSLIEPDAGAERDAQAEHEGDDEAEQDVDAAEDEEAEASDEESDDEDESTLTIKVNGKELTVTKAEAIELAQKGADYTSKTMALAEERKQLEAVKSQSEQVFQQQQQALQHSLGMAQALAQYMEQSVGAPPDISILHQHGSEAYIAEKEQYEHRKALLAQAQQAAIRTQQEADRQRHLHLMQKADATEKALRDTLPGWNDDTLTDLAKYGESFGLVPGTVDAAFVEKGFWEVLHKAKQYDAIQARKAEMKPKQALAKVAKPSAVNHSAKASDRANREEAFRKNPSTDALADLLIHR